MQNINARRKNSEKSHLKAKVTKESAFREANPGKPVSINKFYIYGIIIFFSFILYGNTFFYDYALDDAYVITDNKYTQEGIRGIKDIFSYDSFKGYKDNILNTVSGGRYRPLSIATFAIEYEFFGNNPHLSHFFNVLFYALTCLIIFVLLSKLLDKYPHKKWYITIPFIATILFIAHPVHTEVVANIKSRDEIFSLLFSLLTLWFMWKYLDSKKLSFLIYSCVLFSLALFSKESSLVFIAIIPLTFYYFTNHSPKKIILSSVPLVIILIAFMILRMIVIARTGSSVVQTKDLMVHSFFDMNIMQKYATITYSLGLYVKLLIFPHPLTWDYYPYHITTMEWTNISVLLSFGIYLFLIYIAFKGLKHKNYFSWGIFIFLISISITSNILFPIGAFMCERFLFAASLGFTMIIAYLIVVKPGNYLKNLFSKPYILLIPLLALYSLKTITRNKAWKNSFTLFETDVITSSNSAKSNACYADELYHKAEKCKDINEQDNYYRSALRYCEKAFIINPNSQSVKSLDLYGNILYNKADSSFDRSEKARYYELAFQYCEAAFKINPNRQKANFVLGNIYGKYKNDLNKSIYYLNNAMNLAPNDVESYNNLGIAYGIAKEYDKALEIFEKALKIAPHDTNVLNNLAIAYTIMGKTDKAKEFSSEARKVKEMEKKK
jgi:protein O-mannosyl-transferase